MGVGVDDILQKLRLSSLSRPQKLTLRSRTSPARLELTIDKTSSYQGGWWYRIWFYYNSRQILMDSEDYIQTDQVAQERGAEALIRVLNTFTDFIESL